MKIGLKDTGIHINDVHHLDDAVSVLKSIANKLNAQPIKIPKTFYGTLAELVSDGLIAPPRLDDKGEFINTQRGQILRAANGEVAYLYIPDLENAYKNQSERNKVHMYWCRTLVQMWQENRKDRYWGTTDTEGLFGMENGARIKLNVCQNCYQYIGTSKYGSINDFDFRLFSVDHANKDKISYGKKTSNEQYVWTCCKCGKTILDINEVEINNSETYCSDCFDIESVFLPLAKAENISDLDNWILHTKDIKITDYNGQNALMYLSQKNPNPALIQAMIKKYQFDVNAVDKKGKDILMYLVDQPKTKNEEQQYKALLPVINLLAKHGITVKGHSDNNHKTAIGYTKNSLIHDYLLSQYTAAGGQVRSDKPVSTVYVTDSKTGIISQQE